MDSQVPSDSVIEHLFGITKTRESEYFATKEVGRLHGINLATVRNRKRHNKSLLHFAAGFGRHSWVKGLIDDGSDVDAQDNEGETPLHAACNHAHKKVAKLLLDSGADVNRTDNKGWSALHYALSRLDNATKVQPHYWEVVELLILAGANPFLKSSSGKTSFDRIRDADQKLSLRLIHVLKKLDDLQEVNALERYAIIDRYLRIKDFFDLVKVADQDFIASYIPARFDIETTINIIEQVLTPRLLRSRLESCDGITPLHRAAGYGHLEVARLFIKFGERTCVDLTELVNSRDRDERIPLHNAAMYGHDDMIRLLVENGSDVNHQDSNGYTPLHVAAESEMEGIFVTCLKLIELQADPERRSFNGKSPFDLAKSDEVKKVLELKQIRMVPSTTEQAIYITKPNEPIQTFKEKLPDDNLMLDSKSERPLFSNTQHEVKIVILNTSDLRYQLIAQRMLDTIVTHANEIAFRSYEIVRVEQILDKKVWSNYQRACQSLEAKYGFKNERLLFHGSNFVDKIQSDGFCEGFAQSKGMFGAGLYFAAHSSKSNQYAFGLGQGCRVHNDKSCYTCERKMIYAQVALGKSLVSQEAIPDISHAPPGHSSVTGQPGTSNTLKYPEYVIYNGDHAYPLYVITYRIIA